MLEATICDSSLQLRLEEHVLETCCVDGGARVLNLLALSVVMLLDFFFEVLVVGDFLVSHCMIFMKRIG